MTLKCKVVSNASNSTTEALDRAHCVGMNVHFDGTANASFFTVTLRISPEQIDIGGLFHDNKWPDESPIHEMADADEPAKKEPSALGEGLHTLLDVVGMIPIVGEIADGANALVYLAEGNKTDAALSAAAMIPLAGNLATGAKLVRKGVKIAEKAQTIKKIQKTAKAGLKKVDGYVTGTHEALVKAKKKDSHHVIQDAAMRDIPGYNRQKAPTIQLSGPSTRIGSPHYNATQAQRRRGGGTYGAERKLAYRALREAGVPTQTAKKVVRQTDKYFRKLGVTLSTPTRIPGNRPK